MGTVTSGIIGQQNALPAAALPPSTAGKRTRAQGGGAQETVVWGRHVRRAATGRLTRQSPADTRAGSLLNGGAMGRCFVRLFIHMCARRGARAARAALQHGSGLMALKAQQMSGGRNVCAFQHTYSVPA